MTWRDYLNERLASAHMCMKHSGPCNECDLRAAVRLLMQERADLEREKLRAIDALAVTKAQLKATEDLLREEEAQRKLAREAAGAKLERLTQELAEVRLECQGQYEMTQREREIAKAAEAKLAEATIRLRLLPSEAAWQEGARMLQEADRARQAAEAEVERLREVVAGELAYRHTVEAQVVELSAQANQLEREAGAAQDENQRLRVALLLAAAVEARLRARWPHIEIPINAGAGVLGKRSTADPGSPTCLRCSIEDEIRGPEAIKLAAVHT